MRSNGLDVSNAYADGALVHATIYGRGQMVIPARAREEAGISQGDVVEVRPEGDGKIVLVRMEKAQASPPIQPKITRRRGSHAVGTTDRAITSARVHKLLTEL